VRPATCCAGTDSWSGDAGRICTDGRDGRRSIVVYGRLSFDSHARTGAGYRRIVGEQQSFGVSVSATSVRATLLRHGLPPAPQRDEHSWRDFLRQHAATTLACDFFTVETAWLKRIYVLFFISLERIEFVACTPKPTGAWVAQQARNLLMTLDDREHRSASSSTIATRRDRRDPYAGQAPNANAHAEHWVGSARRECLDRLSSSVDGNSSTCFASIPAITTSIGRLGHSHSIHPSKQTETRPRGSRCGCRQSRGGNVARSWRPENPGASTVWAEHSRIAAYCF
jgi:hypothetical protein